MNTFHNNTVTVHHVQMVTLAVGSLPETLPNQVSPGLVKRQRKKPQKYDKCIVSLFDNDNVKKAITVV